MIFHILNGDALASQFSDSIPGDRIIFREALIDGPVKAESIEEFWRIRNKYISENFNGSPDFDYSNFTVSELEKIQNLPQESKIYCWFEEDLFCQINLWFVIYLLRNQQSEVFLVLPYPNSPYQFTHHSEDDLIDLFETKAHFLNIKEREILETLWQHFQNEEIFEALQIGELFKDRFPFLKQAVEAWRDMIPVGEYPGKPKATLLEIQQELQTIEFESVFKEFQKRLPVYGLGDLQVKKMGKEVGIFS